MLRRLALFVFAMCASSVLLSAQSAPLTLAQAVESASKNYPSIRVSQEQMNAAAEGIRLARTAYLPRVDALAQVNRATRNNVFGLLLPQNVIPSMSGPVIGSNNTGTVWGSALGALASWEPFDFGLRQANVAAAEATKAQAESSVKRSQFEVSAATIDAYLTLAAAQEMVRASQAGVERAETVLRMTDALVNAQLRPGADSSRAQAELAAARTQLVQSKQAVEVARATLSQFVGLAPSDISIAAPALLQLPAQQTPAQADFKVNPVTLEQNATVEQARTQLRAMERSYFPKFSLQAAAYARGTGAETDGSRPGRRERTRTHGAGFRRRIQRDIPDYGFARVRAQRKPRRLRQFGRRAAKAEQIVIELKTRWNVALAQFTEQEAWRKALRWRYPPRAMHCDKPGHVIRRGWERLILWRKRSDWWRKRKSTTLLSHLSVWRALLGLATAAGDLQPFVVEASK